MALSYYEQLNHPLWLSKKQEIMERDGFCCTICGSDIHKLEVHHLCYYPDSMAWEYDNELMVTVCRKHHTELTYDMPKVAGIIAFSCLKNNVDLATICEILLKFKK